MDTSNKKFGMLFTSLFTLAFAYFYWIAPPPPGDLVIGLASLAVIFAFITIFFPSLFTPLIKAWFSLGLLMGKVVSPIILGGIFFSLIAPVAITTRLFGRDELLLKKREVKSYWIEKEAIDPDSFKNQF